MQRIYQFAHITIFNLSPDTETDIFKNGKSVTIEAGYDNGPYGVIFTGPIRQPIRGKDEDGVTYFLRLVCISGDDKLNLGFASFVLTNGKTVQDIATQVCRSSNIPFDVRISGEFNQQRTSRGKVIFGNPTDTMRSLAVNNNSNYYVDDDQAYLSSLSKSPPAVVPEINAHTGMIGIPQQVAQGVRVRILINPTIKLDSWIKLNNQDIVQAELKLFQLQTLLDLDGLYRVVEIRMIGDTRGNDWYYDLETISQAGRLPLMLSSASQSGF